MGAWVSCQEKARCHGTNDGDTRGCRALLEDVVLVLLLVPGLWVKTFVSMDSAAMMLFIVFPLRGVFLDLMCAKL